MKTRPIKRKVLTLLLALCVVLSLVPVAVFAEPAAATDTADFTVQKGTAAIALLNQYKTDTADSTWDNATKTLTLRGVKFTTTAQTAVKLPAGATIVLKDGTRNTIRSGDVNLEVSGAKNHTFINALDAAGSLTIEGGTGSLSVYAGALKNKGDGWVYSSGISVDGDFTVKGGRVTARGGCAESDGSCFSFGVKMDSDTKNKALLVTGGTLTAIADEAYELEEGGTKRASFSRGVEMFRGNVIVSGSGKLRAESVEAMAEATVMSNGLYISAGNLTVANSAEVAVAGAYAAYISGGSLRLDGGSLTAVSTQTADDNGNLGCAIDMDMDLNKQVADSGSITVSGGTLETVNGDIRMSTIGATGNQSLFTVTGGTIIGTGDKADYKYYGNGAYSTGNAFVVDTCGYPGGDPTVEIKGGTFKSENAEAVGSYFGNTAEKALTGFITGCSFSSDPTKYAAADYKVTTENGVFTVSKDGGNPPKTFDAGIAVYGVSAILSVTGMAWMGSKKKNTYAGKRLTK